MTSQALTTVQSQQLAALSDYSSAELALIKQTIAKDCTDLELALFVATAKSRGLNPFSRQLYAIKYKGVMQMVAGIDGYRAIAARSQRYAGSDEPQFGQFVNSDGVSHPEYATVTVYKVVAGLRVPFVGKAYWDEFVRKFNGKAGDMWLAMPRNQLAKCAEAQALRKGFPELMEGIEYTEPDDVPFVPQEQLPETTQTIAGTPPEPPQRPTAARQAPARPQGQAVEISPALQEQADKFGWGQAALMKWLGDNGQLDGTTIKDTAVETLADFATSVGY